MVGRRGYFQDLIIIRSGESWEGMKKSLHAGCLLNVYQHGSSDLQSGLVTALRADKKCTVQVISWESLPPTAWLAVTDLSFFFTILAFIQP